MSPPAGAPAPHRPKRDPRILLGYVTAAAYAVIMGGKVAVWGLEDPTHIPIILAPLLFLACGLVGYRWWTRTRHEEWLKRGGRRDAPAAVPVNACRKCGASLEGVKPSPVSIKGLNVVRVVCPRCGRVCE